MAVALSILLHRVAHVTEIAVLRVAPRYGRVTVQEELRACGHLPLSYRALSDRARVDDVDEAWLDITAKYGLALIELSATKWVWDGKDELSDLLLKFYWQCREVFTLLAEPVWDQ